MDEMLSKIPASVSLLVCDLLEAVAFLYLTMSSFVSFLTFKNEFGVSFLRRSDGKEAWSNKDHSQDFIS